MNRRSPRPGDSGMTTLLDGRRVSKGSAEVELSGNLDELNVALGLARVAARGKKKAILCLLQEDVEIVLSGKAGNSFFDECILKYEEIIKKTSNPSGFETPGRNIQNGLAHFARVAVRRIERQVVRSGRDKHLLGWLNRMGRVVFSCC